MTAETCVAADCMGALEVPAHALWGAQMQRAIENFPAAGLKMSRGLVLHVAAEMADLSREEFKRLLDPRTLTKGGVSSGG